MAFEINFDDTPTGGANPYIDSLVAGGAWSDEDGGPVTVNYSFELMPGVVAGGFTWSDAEKAAVAAALQKWSAVANIEFVAKEFAFESDIHVRLANPQDMEGLEGGAGALGLSEVPGFNDSGTFDVWFNREGDGWGVEGGLSAGGYAFVTMVHELGHALGLAHPHDGYASGPEPNKFPGVTSPGSLGDFDLNQGIYTIMTYNDGWQTKYPEHTATAGNFGFGWQASAMAFDIAAIQTIYGMNMATAAEDSTYELPTVNGVGASWTCIWDAGGSDTITAANATAGSNINLSAATLTGAAGGGIPSYVGGIVGGFTIANGVEIEHATGSEFEDVIIGNTLNNTLTGLGGNDKLEGGLGADHLDGGDGYDYASYYNDDSVTVALDDSFSAVGAAAGDTFDSIEALTGSLTGSDTLAGNDAINTLRGYGGNDIFYGRGGNDKLFGGDGNDTFYGGAGGDKMYGGEGRDKVSYYADGAVIVDLVNSSLNAGDASGDSLVSIEILSGSRNGSDQISGDAFGNTLYGNGGNDKLSGRAGNDRLVGGKGADILSGGSGADLFRYNGLAEGGDRITAFSSADYFEFKGSAFRGLTKETFSARNFIVRTDNVAQDKNDYFIYCSTDHSLWFDADGSRAGSPTLMAKIDNAAVITFADILIF
jgi:serralysin